MFSASVNMSVSFFLSSKDIFIICHTTLIWFGKHSGNRSSSHPNTLSLKSLHERFLRSAFWKLDGKRIEIWVLFINSLFMFLPKKSQSIPDSLILMTSPPKSWWSKWTIILVPGILILSCALRFLKSQASKMTERRSTELKGETITWFIPEALKSFNFFCEDSDVISIIGQI